MSWCAEWMRDWLDAEGRSQYELARLANVDAANVSRWLRGQSKPDREAVAKLTEILPQHEAAELVCAWLRDQMPKYAEQLVDVRAIPTSMREEPPAHGETPQRSPSAIPTSMREEPQNHEFPQGISTELRKRLIFFGKLAVQNPEIRKILDVCYKAAKRGSNHHSKESK